MTTARESVELAQAQVEARRALERIAAAREERERQQELDRRFSIELSFVGTPFFPRMHPARRFITPPFVLASGRKFGERRRLTEGP